MALLPGSPALDAGASIACTDTDQRGVSRPQYSCDIGAFESQGFTLNISEGDNQSTAVNTTFANPLRVTVVANVAAEPVGPGGFVNFVAPDSGASLSTANFVAVTTAGGSAGATVTANDVAGSYQVRATTRGADSPANFNLINTGNVTLTLTKTVELPDPAAARPGDPLIYTLVLANSGSTSASGVILQDILPAGVAGSDLNWTGTVTGGQALTFTIKGTVTNAAGYGIVITNTATFTHPANSGSADAAFTIHQPTLYLPVVIKADN